MAHLTGQERARYVARMFARISHRYDLLNAVMSGGRHHAWRRMAARMAVEGLSGPTLDVACGTGDFAFELARLPNVSEATGVDFTRGMLEIANGKAVALRKRIVAGIESVSFASTNSAYAGIIRISTGRPVANSTMRRMLRRNRMWYRESA